MRGGAARLAPASPSSEPEPGPLRRGARWCAVGFSREIQRGLGKLQTGILPVLGQAAADRWRSIVRVTGTGAESQDKKSEQTGARKRTGRKRPRFLSRAEVSL